MTEFPVICVDDFFDNPDEIRDYALSLDYDVQEGIGIERTKELFLINPVFFESLANRLISVFAPTTVWYNYTLSAMFQKMRIMEKDELSEINCGGIHTDTPRSYFAGVVYLSPDANLDSGTSVFRRKNKSDDRFSHKLRDKDFDAYKKYKLDFYKEFETTIEVKNIYNRLVMFDSNEWHRPNNFYCDGKEKRLNLVFFFDDYQSEFPAMRDRMLMNPIKGLEDCRK